MGVEQRHAIGEFVADDEVALGGVVLSSQRGPGQGASVVAEVVLDSRGLHFEFVELENELENLSELFDQSLLGLQVLRWGQIARAQLVQDLWYHSICKIEFLNDTGYISFYKLLKKSCELELEKKETAD